MSDSLLTTSDVAALMGVGATSVKRWADAGVLRCVKTAGGHRRFLRTEVERFLTSQVPIDDDEHDPLGAEAWVRTLKTLPDVHLVQAKLLEMRARRGSWWRTSDDLTRVFSRLGQAWQNSEMSVLEERVATELLHRALAAISASIPLRPSAHRLLLANAPGDDYTLNLALAELTARERGWNTIWVGRRAPVDELICWAQGDRVHMVSVCASRWSTDSESLRHVAEGLADACSHSATGLLLSGGGAWPDAVRGATRVWSMEQLRGALS